MEWERTSRKFRVLIIDTVVTLVLFFGAKYLAPNIFEDIKTLILYVQPIFVAVVLGTAWEDAAEKGAQVIHINPLPVDEE